MPPKPDDSFTVPQGVWVRVGSWQVRVVENTIGGHVWQKRKAPKRVRKRSDGQRFDVDSKPSL